MIEKGNRVYKDRLFRMLFSRKEDLLELYNAVNDSQYTDPEELEITTLEDVLYLGMKNDISFLIDGYMNLYEEQSTWNPNMPLRGLFYFSKLYSSYVERNHLDIYSRTQIILPTPKYLVFYIGTPMEPERQELHLSSAFEKTQEGDGVFLECSATVLNIRYGRNKALMERCRKLYEYSYLVEKIQMFLEKGLTLESSIDLAIEDCLSCGILTDFLHRQRGEAKLLILERYDEELHAKTLYNEGFEDGEKKGLVAAREATRINELTRRLLAEDRIEELKRALDDAALRGKLMEELGI